MTLMAHMAVMAAVIAVIAMGAMAAMAGAVTTAGAMGAVRAMRLMGAMGGKCIQRQHITQNNNHRTQHQKFVAGNIAFFILYQVCDFFHKLRKQVVHIIHTPSHISH